LEPLRAAVKSTGSDWLNSNTASDLYTAGSFATPKPAEVASTELWKRTDHLLEVKPTDRSSTRRRT
jgi:hypothetical protein